MYRWHTRDELSVCLVSRSSVSRRHACTSQEWRAQPEGEGRPVAVCKGGEMLLQSPPGAVLGEEVSAEAVASWVETHSQGFHVAGV